MRFAMTGFRYCKASLLHTTHIADRSVTSPRAGIPVCSQLGRLLSHSTPRPSIHHILQQAVCRCCSIGPELFFGRVGRRTS